MHWCYNERHKQAAQPHPLPTTPLDLPPTPV